MLKEILFILFSVVGFSLTYYIWKKTIKSKKKLLCFISNQGACDKVIKSKYGHMFGIDNTILGMLYYILILAVGLTYFVYPSLTELSYFILGEKIITGLAAGMSIILTLIQFFVLKQFCEYCTVANIINVLIFAVVWIL